MTTAWQPAVWNSKRAPGRTVPALTITLAMSALLVISASVSTATFPWKRVATPNPGGPSHDNNLSGVAATSSANAWAVGDYNNGYTLQTLIEHWNGSTWSKVASPNVGGATEYNNLNAVTAISAANAWAVGYYGSPTRTLIEHWNGSAWTRVVASPNGDPSGANYLRAATATSASNAWAVGSYYPANAAGDRTLILHWDGSHWSRLAGPNPGGSSGLSELNGVAATSPTNAWAVGSFTKGNAQEQTLIEHWNGTRWSRVASPTWVALRESTAYSRWLRSPPRTCGRWACSTRAPITGR